MIGDPLASVELLFRMMIRFVSSIVNKRECFDNNIPGATHTHTHTLALSTESDFHSSLNIMTAHTSLIPVGRGGQQQANVTGTSANKSLLCW